MKLLYKIATTALLILVTPLAYAQEPNQLDAIAYINGQWTVSASLYEDGKWAVPAAAKRATADTVLGGAFIRLDVPISFGDATFQFEATFSYDRFYSIYRLNFMDDLNGYMDIYQGNVHGAVLTVTNADTGTHFPNGSGGVVIGKLELEKSATGFVLTGSTASQKEGPYSPYVRFEFTEAR